MTTLAIEVSDLTKQYDNLTAVKGATFSVPRGAICGFVGPNGAGKTTTIRMLLGLITPTSGSAKVLGESVSNPEKYLSFVGAMIEGPAFYPALTGAENLRVLATLGGFPIERVEDLITLVGLNGRGGDKYKTYSLGMKQRLGIAAALLPNPALLILDEPTNGLDPEGIQEVRDLLKKLASEGTTVFVSSHLLSEIEIISEYIVMVRKGEVVFAGPIEELLMNQKPTIILRTENPSDLEKIAAIAIAEGHKVSIRGGEAHIEGPHEWAPLLNKKAFEAGITLAQLTPTLPNLEETFFEMTGGK
ncbi:CcmA ABC-type multidrug transport system, ATPase component [Candidatus Nanopelagicaceae bacterium]